MNLTEPATERAGGYALPEARFALMSGPGGPDDSDNKNDNEAADCEKRHEILLVSAENSDRNSIQHSCVNLGAQVGSSSSELPEHSQAGFHGLP